MPVQPRILSGSTNGKGIKITSVTSGSGNILHTSVTGTAAPIADEIYLDATNLATSNVQVSINWGGVAGEDKIHFTVPFKDGLYTLVQGKRLNGGAIVRAYAAVASVVVIHGIVNRIS